MSTKSWGHSRQRQRSLGNRLHRFEQWISSSGRFKTYLLSSDDTWVAKSLVKGAPGWLTSLGIHLLISAQVMILKLWDWVPCWAKHKVCLRFSFCPSAFAPFMHSFSKINLKKQKMCHLLLWMLCSNAYLLCGVWINDKLSLYNTWKFLLWKNFSIHKYNRWTPVYPLHCFNYYPFITISLIYSLIPLYWWIILKCPLQNSYVEPWTPSVTIFRDMFFLEVINIKS